MAKKSTRGKKILAGTILVVLAVVVAFAATFATQHSRGPSRVVENYAAAINEKDFEALCDTFFPSMQEGIRENLQTIGGAETFFKNLIPESFGENTVITVSDLKTEPQKIVDGKYNGTDVAAQNISAISLVEYTMTVKGSLREDVAKAKAVCAKTNGKWYLVTTVSAEEDTATPTDA